MPGQGGACGLVPAWSGKRSRSRRPRCVCQWRVWKGGPTGREAQAPGRGGLWGPPTGTPAGQGLYSFCPYSTPSPSSPPHRLLLVSGTQCWWNSGHTVAVPYREHVPTHYHTGIAQTLTRKAQLHEETRLGEIRYLVQGHVAGYIEESNLGFSWKSVCIKS